MSRPPSAFQVRRYVLTVPSLPKAETTSAACHPPYRCFTTPSFLPPSRLGTHTSHVAVSLRSVLPPSLPNLLPEAPTSLSWKSARLLHPSLHSFLSDFHLLAQATAALLLLLLLLLLPGKNLNRAGGPYHNLCRIRLFMCSKFTKSTCS